MKFIEFGTSHIITKLVNKNNPLVMVGGNSTILTKGEIY